jgi:hypothetical protein
MDESKYTDGFIWSVGPVFNSSEKRLARTLPLLANFGKERRPEPTTSSANRAASQGEMNHELIVTFHTN